MSVIDDLINDVDGSAYWRSEKAKQYPDDDRNIRSSWALTKLGENLRKLPSENNSVKAYSEARSRLDELEEELEDGSDASSRRIEELSQKIGRYGFDFPEDGDPEDFLSGMIDIYLRRVEGVEKKNADEERKRQYQAATESAAQAAKDSAEEQAASIAKEVANKAALAAHKKVFQKAYEEAYEEAYHEALVATQKVKPIRLQKR